MGLFMEDLIFVYNSFCSFYLIANPVFVLVLLSWLTIIIRSVTNVVISVVG